jgi:potassium efflux system protein
VIFLYLSFCVSKLVEVVLLEKFFPGRQLDRGVQLSIARLANYFIVLIGFIGTMMIMGISMTNITILGGAVGVGIGFGLQAIFNNFISGIILLFERPIKIGDVIMVEGDYAEVKELGLRATVVETLDHAEIVIPNSTLITSNVTNWTLGRRQVRIKVPIGVAYGSDVDKVIDIIIQCAHEHPRVLSQPKPLALFVAHGESSLDFELRAFVPDVGDRMSSISELNQAINGALDEAGIEIPFPQRDVHLKTTSYEIQQSIPDDDHPQNMRPSL